MSAAHSIRPTVTQTFQYGDISTLYVSVETNATITHHRGSDLIVNITGDAKNFGNVNLTSESDRLVVIDDLGCSAQIDILVPRSLQSFNITTYKRGQVKIVGWSVNDITITAMSESNVEVDCIHIHSVVITTKDTATVSVKRIGDKHAVSKNFGSTVILNDMKL